MSLIRALKTLQGLRGGLSNIILDNTNTHLVLKKPPDSTLCKLLLGNGTPLLTKAGVNVVLVPRERHEKVGRTEAIIK